jgi:hypothetical protein
MADVNPGELEASSEALIAKPLRKLRSFAEHPDCCSAVDDAAGKGTNKGTGMHGTAGFTLEVEPR